MNRSHQPSLICLLIVATAFGCGRQGNGNNDPVNGGPNTDHSIPVVSAASTYEVLVDSDIEYAEGLVHDNTSASPFAEPQKLDVYYPANDDTNRPVYMFIHGGGFKGGIKHKPEIVHTANYFASRGWVFVSIDYRTTENLGTLTNKTPDEVITYYKGIAPQEWVEYSLQEAESPDQVQTSTAMYTAQRDAKAALRWIIANAEQYHINPDYITVGGASAGSVTTVALGISDQEDFRDEVTSSDDPTLATTNLDQTYVVRSMVYYWGSIAKLSLFEAVYGLNRFDNNDPELFMAHGTENDPVTPYSGALELQGLYNDLGIHNQLFTLEGHGHGAWDAEVDGKGLTDLSFEFLVERQSLIVQ